ncbi:uncharacterized protein UTRI_06633_B [Ustilago trichophora]|uniref:Uncharacterized protein n=1 Tax=Ustilago trichophora TaxID=86804 RepID=A0A5C3EQU4_9BASI|nr:uncharacterized protein UTRI_06633_B [Ustilago trichophora]
MSRSGMSVLDDHQTETWEKDLEERMRSKEEEKSDLVVRGLRDATQLFNEWGRLKETERESRLANALGGRVFKDVVKWIHDSYSSSPHSHLFEVLHQELKSLFQGLKLTTQRVYRHLDRLYKDPSAWKQMDQYERFLTLIRSALPHKNEPSPTQDEPDETSVAVRHIRNAFATKFNGYAVELLLAHIDLHEQSSHRSSRPAALISPEVSHKSDPASTSLTSLPATSTPPTRAVVGIKRKVATTDEEQYLERPTRVATASAKMALKRQVDSPRPSRVTDTPGRSSPVASTSVSGTRHQNSAIVATTSSSTAKTTTLYTPDPDYHYTKVLPIIQSSGFGKTKMCVPLSFYQPGILICTRPSSAENATVSFPPQDEKVFNYFKQHQNKHCSKGIKACSNEDLDALHAAMAFFLSSYCDELHRVLALLMHLSGCFQDPWQGSEPSGMVQGAAAPGLRTSTRVANAARHTVANCWSTVVYALAVSLHRKDDFLKELSVEPPETSCKHSKLSSYGLLPSRSKDRAMGRTPAASTKGGNEVGSEEDAAMTLEQLLHPCARSNMLERICEKATLGLSEYRKKTVGDENHSVKRSLKPALRKLESLVPEALRNKTLFFLALDEFEGFANLLPFLRQVWKIARPERSWILLLNTNSKFAPVASPDTVAAARRTLDKTCG